MSFIGRKIYNFGVRKRNEYVSDQKFKREVHKEVEAEAKADARKEYKEQYSASRKGELIDKASWRGYHDAHKHRDVVGRIGEGLETAGRIGGNFANNMERTARQGNAFGFGVPQQRQPSRRSTRKAASKSKRRRQRRRRSNSNSGSNPYALF